MKKSILMVVLAIFAASVKSYSQDTTKTVFHLSKINYLGIYIAPEFQFGQLKNEFTAFGGGSVMVLLNKKFAVGATMQQSLIRSFSPAGVSPLYLSSVFGGLKLEYTCNPNSVVHLSFPLVLGIGSARTDSTYAHHGLRSDSTERNRIMNDGRNNRSNYFVIQPGVQVEANIIRTVKLYAGANYRFSFSGDLPNELPPNSLQGFSVFVGLKIGLFDLPVKKKKSL